MKRMILVNGAWILIACGAFLFGRNSTPVRDGGLKSGGFEGNRESKRRVVERGRGEIGTRGDLTRSGGGMVTFLQGVLRESDPLKRQGAFADLLDSITAGNVESVVRAFYEAKASRADHLMERQLLMHAWGRLDGAAAMEFGQELEGREKAWAVFGALSGWASEKPEGAQAWVAELESGNDRRKFAEGVISGLVLRDVGEATEYLLSLPEREQDRDQMAVILGHLSREGIERATSWAESLPDGDLKGKALREVAGAWEGRDAKTMAAWAEKYVHSEAGAEVVAKVAEEWAEDEPAEALAWVLTLDESEARNRAAKDALREWTRRDLDAAGEFVAGLDAGSMRDAAASQYARAVVGANPATAMEWARSIGDGEMRAETVVETARRWLREDEAAAREWMEGAGLSADVVERIGVGER